MKVRFLLEDKKTTVDSPYDITDINKYPYFLNHLLYLKSLQFSESFISTVSKLRLHNNVPDEGLPIDCYLKMLKAFPKDIFSGMLTSEKKESLWKNLKVSFEYNNNTYIPSLILAEIRNDLEKFYPKHSYEAFGGFPSSDIGMIALFNTVLVDNYYQKLDSIFWYPENFEKGPLPRINIGIFGNISKNQLQKYIEEVFDREIKPALLELPDLYKNQLTKYELEVYEFRYFNPEKSFREIADILGPKMGKPYLIEDNVKKTYNKAKRKLQNSFEGNH
jgi:hypothetical protein